MGNKNDSKMKAKTSFNKKCFTFCKPCQPLCPHVFSSQVGFGRYFWLSISISTENYCVTYLISFLLFLPISLIDGIAGLFVASVVKKTFVHAFLNASRIYCLLLSNAAMVHISGKGPFFNYVDQILPIIDHLPTLF